jgi:hypothetical protein
MRLYLPELRANAGLDGSPVFARPRDAAEGSSDEVERRHDAEQGPLDDSWLADA